MAQRNDVFGARSQRFGGAFSADDAIIQFGLSRAALNNDGAEVGLAIDSANFQYQQRVGKAYDVTQPVVYVIRGRSEGNGQFQQIAGVRSLAAAFMTTYGDVCAMDKNTLVFSQQSGCGGRQQIQEDFTLLSLLLTGIGQQVSSEDMMIRRSLPFTFLSLVNGNAAA